MRHLSALAVATAALAGAAQAQAQAGSPVVRPLPAADGSAAAPQRLLTWGSKRPLAEPAVVAVAPLAHAAAPETAQLRRVNNRYSARSVAPVSTRAASTTILRAHAPASIYDAPAAAPAAPAPVETTRAAPARVHTDAYVSRPFGRQLQRPTPPVQAYEPAPQPAPAVAAAPAYVAPIVTAPVAPSPVRTAPPTAPVAAVAVDPQWRVREELMRQAPVAPARAEAKAAPVPAPVIAAKVEAPKAAPVAAPIARAAAPVAPAPVKVAAAPAAAPVAPAALNEPWRRRTTDDGPRFYSVHRQFGYTPDPTRPTLTAVGAASADPLPSGFFLAGAPAEDTDDTAATEERQTQVLAKKDDKKSRRRK